MYTMYMTSTIRLSNETKKLISSFGTKGESFETIIKRLYEISASQRLKEFLMPDEKFIPIEEAIRRAKKEWSE